MKKIAAAFLFLFFASSAFAQFTVVSGTVTDASTLPYSGASLSISLVSPVGTVGAYLNGAQISGTVGPLKLDNTGSFVVNLGDNTQIKCANATGQLVTCVPQTQWAFAVTLSPGVAPPLGSGPQTCPASGSTALTISGPSQSVSSSFNACPHLSGGTGNGFGNPAPPANSVQFNNGGVFGGSSFFTFIPTNINPSPNLSLTGPPGAGPLFNVTDPNFGFDLDFRVTSGGTVQVGSNVTTRASLQVGNGSTAAGIGCLGGLAGPQCTVSAGSYSSYPGGNCTSSASPAVCLAAITGAVVIATGSTTVTVNTTSVTANSEIFVQEDDSLGTRLGVTCNTTINGNPAEITAKTANTSFVITTTPAPAVNPACYTFWIIN